MHTFTCGCGVHMSATDAETLAWGVETHVCATPVEDVEGRVVRWLGRRYQGPFWLLRAGHAPALVRS